MGDGGGKCSKMNAVVCNSPSLYLIPPNVKKGGTVKECFPAWGVRETPLSTEGHGMQVITTGTQGGREQGAPAAGKDAAG